MKSSSKPKWLWRLESLDDNKGLWYNASGEFVLGIADIDNCPTKDMPMGYDERYQLHGKQWFSGCSRVDDLTHWYSIENARELMSRGFRFFKYLATEYIEYDMETPFVKETCLEQVMLDIDEVFKN